MHPSGEKQASFDSDLNAAGIRDSRTLDILGAISFFGFLFSIVLIAILFGAVDQWIQSLFVSLICFFSALRIVEGLFRGSFSIAESRLLIPLLSILLLAVIQVVPLDGIPAILSGSRNASPYISIDPYETKQFLFMFAALILLGEGVLNYATTRNRVICIVGTILLIGLGSAIVGFLPRFISGGLFSSIDPTAGYAQFQNRNHFALLMEMALGLLLGFGLRGRFSRVFKVICWTMILFIGVAIISSTSRGGIISSGVIVLVSVLLYILSTRDRKVRSKNQESGAAKRILVPALAVFAIIVLFAGSFVLTIVLIGGDQLVTRFEKVGDEIRNADDGRVSRVEIWRSTIELIRNYPAAGIGFGAYQTGITPFDMSSGGRFKLQQAHNEYLEIAASGGLIALVLSAWFLAALARKIRARIDSGDRFSRASRVGAVAGIVGVLLHSMVDFGLHIFVNAAIFTLLLVISIARVDRDPHSAGSSTDRTRRRKKRNTRAFVSESSRTRDNPI